MVGRCARPAMRARPPYILSVYRGPADHADRTVRDGAPPGWVRLSGEFGAGARPRTPRASPAWPPSGFRAQPMVSSRSHAQRPAVCLAPGGALLRPHGVAGVLRGGKQASRTPTNGAADSLAARVMGEGFPGTSRCAGLPRRRCSAAPVECVFLFMNN